MRAADCDNDPTITGILLAANADGSLVDKSGNTALMLALWKNHILVANRILNESRDANVNAISRRGDTALGLAKSNNSFLIESKLLQAGATMPIQPVVMDIPSIPYEYPSPASGHDFHQQLKGLKERYV